MRAWVAVGAVLLAGCASSHTQSHANAPAPAPSAAPHPSTASTASTPAHAHASHGIVESGQATWYGKVLKGHKTASGERFDPSKMTAAHRTLKLGTWVEVRRTDNGRVVRVRINDRGPVSHRFVIDLSSEAARRLGMVRMGVAPVELRVVGSP